MKKRSAMLAVLMLTIGMYAGSLCAQEVPDYAAMVAAPDRSEFVLS